MITQKVSRSRFAICCAAAVSISAILEGCSGSSAGTSVGGKVNNLYPVTQTIGSAPAGSAGSLTDPSHVQKLSNGNTVVSDMSGDNALSFYDSTGKFLKQIGTPGAPSAAPGSFNSPEGMTVAPNGNLYVVDSNNSRVQVFDQTGNLVQVFGDRGMRDPEDIAVDGSGNSYVVDDIINKVFVFNASGTLVTTFGDTGAFPLNAPLAIAFDPSGHLVIADTGNNRIVTYTTAGVALGAFGAMGDGPNQFNHPVGICFDSHGNFYVNDAGNGRVAQYDSNMKFLFSYQYQDPKSVSNSQKTSIEGFGISVDAAGSIYVVSVGGAYVLAPHS